MRNIDIEAEAAVAVARGHGLWDELDKAQEDLPPADDGYWKTFDRKLKILAEIRQSLALLGRGGGGGGPKSKSRKDAPQTEDTSGPQLVYVGKGREAACLEDWDVRGGVMNEQGGEQVSAGRRLWAMDLPKDMSANPLGALEARALVLCPFLMARHGAQRPPGADWRHWLFMGGRGAGKTRTGAEWVRFMVMAGAAGRVALVGPTLSDVREVMIEGESGLRAVSYGGDDVPRYESSRKRLLWANGAVAQAFSAEDPDSLRGPQFDLAWCDEVAAWARPDATWNTLAAAMRLGEHPQILATTTPRPISLVKRLAKSAALTQAGTEVNAANLAPGFVDVVEEQYAGTGLTRQELHGELMDDPDDALWTRELIEQARVNEAPPLSRVVVAVDPPVSVGPRADACGIIAVGLAEAAGFGRRAFVIGDATCRGYRPSEWGGRAAAFARMVGASMIVAEANQGGEMVRETLQLAHVGVMRALEDEMYAFGAVGFVGSPDRVDALVWGVRELLLRGGDVRVRRV